MLALLRKRGYKKASLSIQKANDAYRLYLKVGFSVVDENEEEYIMICEKEMTMAEWRLVKLLIL